MKVMLPEYLAELEKIEAKYRDVPTGNTVFFGASSIRLWPGLKRAFPAVDHRKLGFWRLEFERVRRGVRAVYRAAPTERLGDLRGR